MTSRLDIYNGALGLCSEEPLVDLTEEGKKRRLLDAAWDNATNRCLEKGLWRFAFRAQRIDHSPDFTKEFGFQFQFDKPDDHVRTAAVCTDEYFRIPLLQYADEGQFWFADTDPIFVRFVSNDPSYGFNIGEWPESFAEYVEAYLAYMIVLPLTQDKERWTFVKSEVKTTMERAKTNDAMKEPTKFMPEGSWVSARTRGRTGRDGGSTSNLIG